MKWHAAKVAGTHVTGALQGGMCMCKEEQGNVQGHGLGGWSGAWRVKRREACRAVASGAWREVLGKECGFP